MSGSRTPSRFWTRILWVFVPRVDREHLTRELAALYRVRLEQDGERAARRWYRGEVLSFAKAVRFGGSGGSAPGPDQSRRVSRSALTDVWRDVQHAGRSLLHNPGFAIVTLMTLTLGVGANTLIFSVVDHVALRPLPYPDADRLVQVWPNEGILRGELQAIQRDNKAFTSVAGYYVTDGFNLDVGGESRRVHGSLVSVELLPLLGVSPALGRNFAPGESTNGSNAVTLLSYGLWRDQYGSDPTIIGRTVVIDGTSRTVVGVLPPDLAFPDPEQDVVLPLVMDPSNVGLFWGWGGHRIIARLKPGVTTEQAREDLFRISRTTRLANPLWTPVEEFRANGTVVPLQDAMVGDVRSTLFLLLGAVGLVLLVACANVANLLLARGLSRSRDVALRSALGASRWRLIRAHLVESLLIAGLGCVVALVVAYLSLGAVIAFLPADIPRVQEIRLDGRVVLAAIVFSLMAGALAGLLPALRGSSIDPGLVLREVGRGSSGATVRRRRLSAAMVVAQVALAVVLVTGAGLFIRSLRALGAVDTGFQSDGIVTARLTLAGDAFDKPIDRYRFFERVVERARTIPGVRSATLASRVPFGPGWSGVATFMDGVTEDPNNLPVLGSMHVMPGFFATLGIPLLAGRDFTSSDGPDAPLVALVDRTAAERFWSGDSPIGRRIRYPYRGAPWIEVVGVVEGVSDGDLASDRRPSFYIPMAQSVTGAATLAIRSDGGMSRVAAAIREIVHDVDNRVPVSALAPLNSLITGSMAQTRWTATLLALFAATTLLLGCVGVYGVVTYSVRARTQEIGVRMALGANRGRIRTAVLGQGLGLAVSGTVLGLLLAVPAARVLEGLLFGVSSLDPLTFATVPLVLIVAALLAAYLPARRATNVHPLDALRTEI